MPIGGVEQRQAVAAHLHVQTVVAPTGGLGEGREQHIGIDREVLSRLGQEVELQEVEEVRPKALRNGRVQQQE